jgi:hypothetical protein
MSAIRAAHSATRAFQVPVGRCGTIVTGTSKSFGIGALAVRLVPAPPIVLAQPDLLLPQAPLSSLKLFGLGALIHILYSELAVRGGMAIRVEVIMPTVKQLAAIAIAIAMAIVGASALGISSADHSATRVGASRITPAKADFRLDDHQRLRTMLLGRNALGRP